MGRRDDGFHDLEALTVSATEPHDTLELHDAATTTVTVTGPFAGGVPSDDDNLVARALHLLDRTMSVTLHKGIPPGAGLGGGSADAAVVLRAFGGTAEQAAALGSDVPFCFHGGPAWMRGRGETVEPIDALAPLDLVIVAPDFGCSTPAVYRAWDDLAGPVSSRAIDAPSGYPGPFGNDLEPAAEHVEPRLRRVPRARRGGAAAPGAALRQRLVGRGLVRWRRGGQRPRTRPRTARSPSSARREPGGPVYEPA